jgi:hypothetical protein
MQLRTFDYGVLVRKLYEMWNDDFAVYFITLQLCALGSPIKWPVFQSMFSTAGEVLSHSLCGHGLFASGTQYRHACAVAITYIEGGGSYGVMSAARLFA